MVCTEYINKGVQKFFTIKTILHKECCKLKMI